MLGIIDCYKWVEKNCLEVCSWQFGSEGEGTHCDVEGNFHSTLCWSCMQSSQHQGPSTISIYYQVLHWQRQLHQAITARLFSTVSATFPETSRTDWQIQYTWSKQCLSKACLSSAPKGKVSCTDVRVCAIKTVASIWRNTSWVAPCHSSGKILGHRIHGRVQAVRNYFAGVHGKWLAERGEEQCWRQWCKHAAGSWEMRDSLRYSPEAPVPIHLKTR